MLILSFESSAKSASCALLRDGLLLAEYFQNGGQTHSRTLTKMAEDMLRNCDLTADDVDVVACASGPGSFTGVRIGVSAAKGFAWGRGIPCCGISTLEAMAWVHHDRDAVIVAVMDARRSQVYNAFFEGGSDMPVRLSPDRAISIDELACELRKIDKTKIFIGDGAQLCYNALEDQMNDLKLPPDHQRWQRAAGVALAAQAAISRGDACDPSALMPNYLRLSQAERERQEKLQNQGKG